MKKIDFAIGANFQLKFAVEEALLDLQAKRMNTPLFNLFGGLSRREVPVMRMLGLKPPKETAAEAQALVDRGYRYVKIKIGLDDKRDIETVKMNSRNFRRRRLYLCRCQSILCADARRQSVEPVRMI